MKNIRPARFLFFIVSIVAFSNELGSNLRAQSKPAESPLVSAMGKAINLSTGTPEELAAVYWQTVLLECKRPGESAPSLFYSEKAVDDSPMRQSVEYQLAEFKGPFTYSKLSVTQSTPAEKLNSGLLWSAVATFQATAFRTTKVSQLPGRNPISWPWSKWEDGGTGASLARSQGDYYGTGALRVSISREKSVTRVAPMTGVYPNAEWEPMSCATAMADDPFSNYAKTAQDHPSAVRAVRVNPMAKYEDLQRIGNSIANDPGAGDARRDLKAYIEKGLQTAYVFRCGTNEIDVVRAPGDMPELYDLPLSMTVPQRVKGSSGCHDIMPEQRREFQTRRDELEHIASRINADLKQ